MEHYYTILQNPAKQQKCDQEREHELIENENRSMLKFCGKLIEFPLNKKPKNVAPDCNRNRTMEIELDKTFVCRREEFHKNLR